VCARIVFAKCNRAQRLRRPFIDKAEVIPYKHDLYRGLSGRNSAVECQLPKLDVAGSIPVARSIFLSINAIPVEPFTSIVKTDHRR
jgi:hypothetical protein